MNRKPRRTKISDPVLAIQTTLLLFYENSILADLRKTICDKIGREEVGEQVDERVTVE